MENRQQIKIDAIQIRNIEKKDNAALAKVIRDTLKEFGANHPGTVYYDESTDHLFEVFETMAGSTYFIAEHNGAVMGGAGIYPTNGLPVATCELVKMYLLPEVRSIGLGSRLIEMCIAFAKNYGYRNIYLESMPELEKALKTYEKFGFVYLSGPMGNTGHFGCEKWMLKDLENGS